MAQPLAQVQVLVVHAQLLPQVQFFASQLVQLQTSARFVVLVMIVLCVMSDVA